MRKYKQKVKSILGLVVLKVHVMHLWANYLKWSCGFDHMSWQRRLGNLCKCLFHVARPRHTDTSHKQGKTWATSHLSRTWAGREPDLSQTCVRSGTREPVVGYITPETRVADVGRITLERTSMWLIKGRKHACDFLFTLKWLCLNVFHKINNKEIKQTQSVQKRNTLPIKKKKN